jgi:hypothetical protein
MIMKWIIIGSLGMAAAFFEVFCVGHWDSETNHGLTFGYWKDYNNIRSSLVRMPGVTIVGTGYNANVILEEFEFDVIATNGVFLKLWFYEQDPVRRMNGNELRIALVDKVEREYTNRIAFCGFIGSR